MRHIIIGVPRSGKSTLSRETAGNQCMILIHTDSFIDEYPWEQRAVYIAGLFLMEPSWVIEGCDAVRGVRKFLQFHPERKPADKVVWLDSPREELTGPQAGFAKGLRKIFFSDIQPQLERLGVAVEINL